jgi:membrane fusion protein, multidrug efflux system
MRAYVDNTELRNKLLAGQYVTVFIRKIRYLNMFSLPQAAIMLDDEGQYVYVIENKKAIRRYIKSGKMYGQGLWMIEDGLKKDDIVITKGNIRIDAGQAVVIDKLREN